MGLFTPPLPNCALRIASFVLVPRSVRPRSRFCVRTCRSRVGPMSKRSDAVIVTGVRNGVNAGLVAPKR